MLEHSYCRCSLAEVGQKVLIWPTPAKIYYTTVNCSLQCHKTYQTNLRDGNRGTNQDIR